MARMRRGLSRDGGMRRVAIFMSVVLSYFRCYSQATPHSLTLRCGMGSNSATACSAASADFTGYKVEGRFSNVTGACLL